MNCIKLHAVTRKVFTVIKGTDRKFSGLKRGKKDPWKKILFPWSDSKKVSSLLLLKTEALLGLWFLLDLLIR